MIFFRSLLFWIFIVSWGAIIPIIYSFVFVTRSRKMADHGAKIWSMLSLWMLKKLCNIDYKVIGRDNIPNQACIIACKHQSMWETIIMHVIFKRPVYAFKKELLIIPFYGWFIRIMSGIIVDRKGGASAIKNLIKQSKKYLNNNQNIILFPQGTRVPVGSDTKKYPYQAGIAALYLSCGADVVPVALNSGKFWAKNSLKKKPGTITIEFLGPIKPGLKKQEFMQELENKIEGAIS